MISNTLLFVHLLVDFKKVLLNVIKLRKLVKAIHKLRNFLMDFKF